MAHGKKTFIPLSSVWSKTLFFRWLYPCKLVNLSESDGRAINPDFSQTVEKSGLWTLQGSVLRLVARRSQIVQKVPLWGIAKSTQNLHNKACC